MARRTTARVDSDTQAAVRDALALLESCARRIRACETQSDLRSACADLAAVAGYLAGATGITWGPPGVR